MASDQATHWRWMDFDEFTAPELYEVLRLRQEVFVREQNCVFLDVDGMDPFARHGLGTISQGGATKLIAYVRILPTGLAYDSPSIGRVVTAPEDRGQGLGRDLMTQAIAETQRLFPDQPITIAAQQYLEGFYRSFGFVSLGDPYLDDDILHVDMQRT
jgi:ElaA protein